MKIQMMGEVVVEGEFGSTRTIKNVAYWTTSGGELDLFDDKDMLIATFYSWKSIYRKENE